MWQEGPMTVWLSVLISGVLLSHTDAPMPKYHLAFTSEAGKLIEVTTDKDGKFQVDLGPGTYRFQWGLVTVDKNTSTVKLHQQPPAADRNRGHPRTPRGFHPAPRPSWLISFSDLQP